MPGTCLQRSLSCSSRYRAASIWLKSSLKWGPREPDPSHKTGPADDPFKHLHWALELDSQRLNFPSQNRCLRWSLHFGQSLSPSLEACMEEGDGQRRQQTPRRAPRRARPVAGSRSCARYRLVYRQRRAQYVLQPLVAFHLLTLFEFPGTKELADELQFGFKV